MGTQAWSVVLPVKRYAAAKSRLRTEGGWPHAVHSRLVAAMVLDTVGAVLGCPAVAEVVVVTDEPALGLVVGAWGARVVPQGPVGGLNAAVRQGARRSHRDRPIVVITADLPALRAGELSEALVAAAVQAGPAGLAYVADASGTGTTVLTATSGAALKPRFGPGSAARHRAIGARPLAGQWPSLRQDVDTLADLAAATRLGLGPRTAAVVRAYHNQVVRAQLEQAVPGRPRLEPVQGTIASFDPDLRSGTVLLDSGAEISFPATAFDASGLRLLRPGQRVQIDQDGPLVTRIGLITMTAR